MMLRVVTTEDLPPLGAVGSGWAGGGCKLGPGSQGSTLLYVNDPPVLFIQEDPSSSLWLFSQRTSLSSLQLVLVSRLLCDECCPSSGPFYASVPRMRTRRS